MKRHHQVDEVFRQKLEQFDSEAPMHLWDNINKALDERRKRVLPLWDMKLLYLAGALFTGAMILLWQTLPENKPELGSFPVEVAKPAATKPTAALSPVVEKANEATEVAAKIPKSQQPPLIAALTIQTENATAADINTTSNTTPEALSITTKKGLNDTAASTFKEITTADNKDKVSSEEVTMLPSLLYSRDALASRLTLPQDIKCARFGGSTWRFYGEILGSIDLPMREFTSRYNEWESYARRRRETETGKMAFSSTIRFSAVSDKGFALRTGIQYSEIDERFSYFNENEQRTIITDIYGPDGQLLRTDTVLVAGAEYAANNHYRLIDLPLIVGFERNFGKFAFAINAGAQINVFFDADGQFLSPEDLQQPVTFGNDNKAEVKAYRDRLGLSWYGSVGFIYHMNPTWQLVAEPAFRIYPQSFTRASYPVDHRYFVSGLNLGIRHGF